MIKHVLAIAAGKGGVGKSVVAVNLALALQRKGARVGLLDADLYGPSIRHMLPEEQLPAQSLIDPTKILPAIAKGIFYISMSFFRDGQEASLVRAPIANAAIVQFIQSVEWGDLDYLIIDFPPGTGDIQLTLSQQANLSGAFLITLPQVLSRIDVLKAAQLFEQTNIPILGIVENMYDLFPGDSGNFLSRELGVPLVSRLPFDSSVCDCADRGLDLFVENPHSLAVKPFMDLASEVEKALSPYVYMEQEVKFVLKDSNMLRLEWEDGLIKEISLTDLQAQCPCIRCKENKTKLGSDIRADKVLRKGRYALSIHYQSGCSRGIYPFAMLRSWRK